MDQTTSTLFALAVLLALLLARTAALYLYERARADHWRREADRWWGEAKMRGACPGDTMTEEV